MRLACTLVFMSLVGAAQAQTPEMRCGWFSNPSPANASLNDRDGEWIVAVQGGYQAKGDWPDGYGKGQWISLGPSSYGYGCTCMKVTIDKMTRRVVAIIEAKARPLAACRSDKALTRVEDSLK